MESMHFRLQIFLVLLFIIILTRTLSFMKLEGCH
jgi:hypothetical protein